MGLCAVASVALGAPMTALAASSQTFSMTPGGLAVNAAQSFTAAGTLDSSAGTPQTVTVTLPPGLLASANASPTCLSSHQQNATCLIGTGTISTVLGGSLSSIPFSAYLAPAPTGGDIAGVDLAVPQVTSGSTTIGPLTIPAAIDLSGASAVLAMKLAVNLQDPSISSYAGALTGLSMTVNSTVNGQPFTRMPSNCQQAVGSLTVTYSGSPSTETTNNSAPFTPTGCSGLPYNPSVSVSATKDADDNGVALSAEVTQTAGQAATKSVTLNIPTNLLSPNAAAAASLLCSAPAPYTGCPKIGTASGTTPLLPGTLSGNVYLLGPISQSLTIAAVIGAPYNVEIDGTVNLANNTVQFNNLPDVPLSDLKLSLNSNPQALTTTCAPSSATGSGSATGQGGQPFSADVPISIGGCTTGGNSGNGGNGGSGRKAGPPTVFGIALGGLGNGKASLKFKLAAGLGAPKIKSFKVMLPGGLRFNAKAFTGKKLAKAISVAGGGKFTAKVSGGALVVTLSRPASPLTVSISSSALSVSKSLSKSAKKHKDTLEKVTVTLTDAGGTTTTLTLPFKKPS